MEFNNEMPSSLWPKILIVDDKVENLVALERLLVDMPAKTVRATSGNEALTLTLEHDFALILLDVQMPVMDGFEVAKFLHDSSKTRHLPIIFLSAVYSGDVFLLKGIESGAVDFLEKPIKPELLRGKVRLFLELYEHRRNLVDYSAQQIVSQITDGVMILNKQQKVLLANPAAELMLDCQPGQLIGVQFKYPVDTEKLMEIELQEESGQPFFVELNSSLIKWSDEDAYLISMRDITLRKQLEEELYQSRKMKAIGHMAEGIAHNFNNNLSIILGNIELAQMSLDERKNVLECLQNAKIAIHRSRDLVQQILTYGRKDKHNYLPTVLYQVIKETLKLLRSTLPTTIQLETVVDIEDQSLAIMADSSQIQEAIINFYNNAVQAIGGKGTITISLESATIEDSDVPSQFNCDPGQYAKLSIQDTGCGIPTAIIDNIFDPFFTTKELCDGTGMGLATVQGIVDAHRGMIKVNSIVGEGSRFDLYFPLIKVRQQEEEPEDNPIASGTETILMVDDEEMLTSAWAPVLENYGYQVLAENSPLAALELIRNDPERFDLLITDQTMPELTGIELAEKACEIKPELPVILCTGYNHRAEDTLPNIHSIIKARLTKPLDATALLKNIRKVLG